MEDLERINQLESQINYLKNQPEKIIERVTYVEDT
jgi:hypothetical protein